MSAPNASSVRRNAPLMVILILISTWNVIRAVELGTWWRLVAGVLGLGLAHCGYVVALLVDLIEEAPLED